MKVATRSHGKLSDSQRWRMLASLVLAFVTVSTTTTVVAFSLTASTSVSRDGDKAKKLALFSNLPPEERRRHLETSSPSSRVQYSKQYVRSSSFFPYSEQYHQHHIQKRAGTRRPPLSQSVYQYQARVATPLVAGTVDNTVSSTVGTKTNAAAVVKNDRPEKPLSPEELQFRAEARARMRRWQAAQQRRRSRIVSKSSSSNDDDVDDDDDDDDDDDEELYETAVLVVQDLKDVEASLEVEDESIEETKPYDPAFNEAMIRFGSDYNSNQDASQSILQSDENTFTDSELFFPGVGIAPSDGWTDFDEPPEGYAPDEVPHQLENELTPIMRSEVETTLVTNMEKSHYLSSEEDRFRAEAEARMRKWQEAQQQRHSGIVAK